MYIYLYIYIRSILRLRLSFVGGLSKLDQRRLNSRLLRYQLLRLMLRRKEKNFFYPWPADLLGMVRADVVRLQLRSKIEARYTVTGGIPKR
jgi:hypothetical protein